MKLIKKTKMKIADITMDNLIYPRQCTDRMRVSEYVTAKKAGAVFPPVRVCNKTHKLADGWHRVESDKVIKNEEIDVELYSFENEAELIWWSINWNAQHGLKLSPYDTARCLNLGRGVGLSDDQIAQALCMTIDKIVKMEKSRIRIDSVSGRPVEVKRVLSGITSDTVTPEQLQAQKPFNAMRADYSLDRSIDALRYNLIPANEFYIERVVLLEQECQKWLEVNGLKQASNQ